MQDYLKYNDPEDCSSACSCLPAILLSASVTKCKLVLYTGKQFTCAALQLTFHIKARKFL
jgi:hypothetical protein